MLLPVVALGMWALGALLVNRGVLANEGAFVVCTLLGLALLARMLMSKLVVDGTGVEVVNFLRSHRFRWSEIARIQVAADRPGASDNWSLEFVLRPSGRRRARAVRASAAAVGGAAREVMVDTLNAHAALHGIPSSITAAKLGGRESTAGPSTDDSPSAGAPAAHEPVAPADAQPMVPSRRLSVLAHASPATRKRLVAHVDRIVTSHPRTPRRTDRGPLLRLAVRGARGGWRSGVWLALVVPAWLVHAGFSSQTELTDPAGVVIIGAAGAAWVVGLVILPLADYRRLRRAVQLGPLATAVVTAVVPPSTGSGDQVEVVRHVEDPRGSIDDRSTVSGDPAVTPAVGARTRVLLDPRRPRVALELGPA